ncbi:MAG: hypothetical protein PHI40_03340 [Caldisericia bacterium]|nr:hypothetical protein [Caldisericia bacterium]MDD4614427.1 hypothetical protein [Caldisericia bacterium]
MTQRKPIVSGSQKTICYFNLPAWGHIYPTLDLVKDLTKKHTVFYFSTPAFQDSIESVGAHFVDIYSFWHSSLRDEFRNPEKVMYKASYFFLETIGYSLEISYWLVSQLRYKKNQWKPDILIHDNCCLWGKLLATVWEVPAICTFSTFVLQSVSLKGIPLHWLLDEWKGYKGGFRFVKYYSLFRLHYPSLSIAIKDMVVNKEKENLVFLPKKLQIHAEKLDASFKFLPRSFRYRASTNSLRRYPSSTFLYVSLGTIHTHNIAILQSIVRILSSLRIPSIVSAGVHYRNLQNPQHKLIQIYPFVDQISILQHSHCKGFVTHGGMNSVVEAITYHIPLFVIPQTMEQLITGKQIQSLKMGVVLPKKYPSYQDLYTFFYLSIPLQPLFNMPL